MHLRDMITRCRRKLGSPAWTYDADTTGFFTNLEIIEALDDAQNELHDEIAIINPWLFEATTNISFVADQEAYSMPGDAPENVAALVATREDTSPKYYVNFIDPRDRLKFDSAYNEPVEGIYIKVAYIRNGKICIRPIPKSAAADAITVKYIRQPRPMHSGTAAAITDSTLTLAASAADGETIYTRDDYYVNTEFELISGTDADNQITTCTDYTTAKVATVDAWGTLPSGTVVYSTRSTIPEKYHRLLVLRACMALGPKDNHPQVAEWENKYERAKTLMLLSIRPQRFRAEHVRPHGSYGR